MEIGNREYNAITESTLDLEVLVGQNVLKALATIVFDGAKKVVIPIKLKNGMSYKVTVKEDAE
ncbi:hypothetical protein [Streptococcus sp. AM43-2AT]|uniref:hypothetical protein n=1 Tax=Streptococcus sp. AM43-2AT TaxID=2293247 RepID=UPI000EEFF64C|nr:hypothetical protein [Streptococcus sp. AM43-2AT]RJU23430.1 hypothetical protein DW930_09100 [Streptococcus sp. AM43-2AT]